VHGIHKPCELPGNTIELRHANDGLARRARVLGKARHQRRPVLLDTLRLVAKNARNLAQHIDECGFAVARAVGKIGAAPEWLAARREKHCERPAAMLAKMVQRGHVDLIDIGALFPIDLDVQEKFVHDARSCFVLEAFMRHDMAPMASGVAD